MLADGRSVVTSSLAPIFSTAVKEYMSLMGNFNLGCTQRRNTTYVFWFREGAIKRRMHMIVCNRVHFSVVYLWRKRYLIQIRDSDVAAVFLTPRKAYWRRNTVEIVWESQHLFEMSLICSIWSNAAPYTDISSSYEAEKHTRSSF